MKQAEGVYCSQSPSCLEGAPREPFPQSYSKSPSLIPVGAEKWLRRSATTAHPWTGSLWGLLNRA